LREVLHPRADRGPERGEPDEPEVPVGEGAGHAMQPRARGFSDERLGQAFSS
jgi:hypothetical protein